MRGSAPIRSGRSRRPPAFTLTELLVVVGIIAVLLTLVVGIGSWAIEQSKRRQTRALLTTLDMAIEDFKTQGPLDQARAPTGEFLYMDRYGGYPPDELEPFTKNLGIPNNRGATLILKLEGEPIPSGALPSVPNRDTLAMVAAIRRYSDRASATLDRVGENFRFKSIGTLSSGGAVLEEYHTFVDAWGNPIQYFATNPASAVTNVETALDDVPAKGARLATSKALVQANNGRPVLMSYGPDGKDQLSGQFPDAQDVVTDWWKDNQGGNDPAGSRKLDNRFNVDNVYSADGLEKKLGGN